MEFQTVDGVPVPAVSVSQMREADLIAMSETGPSLEQMMGRSGASLADFVCEQWPRGAKVGPIAVLAGAGHNGGGGVCAARYLRSQGAEVWLTLSAPADRLADATAGQLEAYLAAGGECVDVAMLKAARPFLVIDAMIGYGLKGQPAGMARELIPWANGTGAPVISLDLPSGLHADTGLSPGACIMARQTLTLALPKPGLKAGCVGDLWLADIGIRPDVFARLGLEATDPFAGASRIRLRVPPAHSPVLGGLPLG